MSNILLAAYLLIVLPAWKLWESRRPPGGKPPRAPFRQYWAMVWPVSIMLAVLWFGAHRAGFTACDLGLDVPLSRAGAWGLVAAVALLAGLSIAGAVMTRRYPPAVRADKERELLATRFPWPRTGAEAIAFTLAMSLMTAAWEILYRGFALLFLAPWTGLPAAVALAALAYGLAHGYQNPKQLAGSIVSAFLFTIAYAATHSLWWLMVIHAGLPLSVAPAVWRARRNLALDAAGVEATSLPDPAR